MSLDVYCGLRRLATFTVLFKPSTAFGVRRRALTLSIGTSSWRYLTCDMIPLARDGDDLGTLTQLVQIVRPCLQHLPALLEKLGPVAGPTQCVLHRVIQLRFDHCFVDIKRSANKWEKQPHADSRRPAASLARRCTTPRDRKSTRLN